VKRITYNTSPLILSLYCVKNTRHSPAMSPFFALSNNKISRRYYYNLFITPSLQTTTYYTHCCCFLLLALL